MSRLNPESSGESTDPAGETGMSRGRSRRFLWSMALIALVVNLPLVSMLLNARQLAADGVPVEASLVEVASSNPGEDPWVSFRLNEEVDPERTLWAARVTKETAEAAEASGALQVRVLPDRPAVHRVQGQVRGYAGLATTLVIDGLLVLVGVWWWRARRRAVRPA